MSYWLQTYPEKQICAFCIMFYINQDNIYKYFVHEMYFLRKPIKSRFMPIIIKCIYLYSKKLYAFKKVFFVKNVRK